MPRLKDDFNQDLEPEETGDEIAPENTDDSIEDVDDADEETQATGISTPV